MATSSDGGSSSSVSAVKARNKTKDTTPDLEKQMKDLKAALATATSRIAALEARPVATAPASAPAAEGVSRHEWNKLLKKLSSYIGFRL